MVRTLGWRRAAIAAVAAAGVLAATVAAASAGTAHQAQDPGSTATPIKHLVIIFQENVSFDHYLGTYPYAANSCGEPFARPHHRVNVNALYDTAGSNGQGTLLTNNPNRDASGNQVNPRRRDCRRTPSARRCSRGPGRT